MHLIVYYYMGYFITPQKLLNLRVRHTESNIPSFSLRNFKKNLICFKHTRIFVSLVLMISKLKFIVEYNADQVNKLRAISRKNSAL